MKNPSRSILSNVVIGESVNLGVHLSVIKRPPDVRKKVRGGVKPYSYEVTKIESLSGSSQNGTSLSDALNNSIPAAKLLENVEKSYDKGVKLLDATYKTKGCFPTCNGNQKVPTPYVRNGWGNPF